MGWPESIRASILGSAINYRRAAGPMIALRRSEPIMVGVIQGHPQIPAFRFSTSHSEMTAKLMGVLNWIPQLDPHQHAGLRYRYGGTWSEDGLPTGSGELRQHVDRHDASVHRERDRKQESRIAEPSVQQ